MRDQAAGGVSDLASQAAAEIATPDTGAEVPDLQRRQAYVTSIAADHLSVGIKFPESAAEITGVRFMHDLPAVDDTVWVDKLGPDLVVASSRGLPIGTCIDWTGTAANIPPNWALADGRSAGPYPRYQAATGRSTLPDLRGRMILGEGQGTGLTNRVAYATGGSETHVLTVGQLPAHNHAFPHGHSMQNHTHGIAHTHNAGGDGTGETSHTHWGTSGKYAQAPSPPGGSPDTLTTGNVSTGSSGTPSANTTGNPDAATTSNAGGDAAHPIMGPYYVLAKIVKVM